MAGLLAGAIGSFAPLPALALDPQAPVVVSMTWLGTPAVGPCGNPHFDRGAARYLAFYCFGALTPDDDNERPDTFWYDRATGVLERVSLTSAGEDIRFESFDGFPSSDGRYVPLESLGPLHPDATPALPGFERRNAFLRDRIAGTTDFISRNALGQLTLLGVGLEDALPERSEVLLQSQSRLQSPPDDPLATNTNLYVRNWLTGAVELISGTAEGELADRTAGRGRLSTGGHYALFTSSATNLPGAPPVGSGSNLYLRDRHAETTQRLTFPWQGGEFTGEFSVDIHRPRITPDGRYVLYASRHPEVLPYDPSVTLLWQQVYLLDRQTGVTERISVDAAGMPGDGLSSTVDMSDDGRYLAFYSRSGNLPAGGRAIYVIDRQTGTWANVTAPLGPDSGGSPNLELARDGSAIAFTWRVTDPALPALRDRTLMYVVDLGIAGPPPEPVAVPGPGRGWLLLLAALLAVGAFAAGRRRPAR